MANALTGPIAAFNGIIGCTIDDPKVSQIASDVGAPYTVWEDEELPDIHFDFGEEGLHKITLLLETPRSPEKLSTRRTCFG